MCTGDNIDTAKAISKNAGIITAEEAKHDFACMTGKEFRETVGEIKKVPHPDQGRHEGEMVDSVGNV